MANISEYTLSTNEFGKPRILTGDDATGQLLVHLILLEPGTYTEHPDMGVGLVSKWRYSTYNKISNLQEEIKKQIDTYLPDLGDTTVKVELQKNHELYIGILCNGTLYKYETNKQDDNTISLKNLI